MATRQERIRPAAAWRGDPRDVRPMLAETTPAEAHARLLARPDLVFEPKYDGIRILAVLDGPAPPALYTRLGRAKTDQFPDLIEPLAALARRRRPLLLDGEIVATDAAGAALPFQRLQDRLHVPGARARGLARTVPAALVVFDLLRDGDEDLRPLPFTARRQRLARLLRGAGAADRIRLIDSTVGGGRALADEVRARDGEGVIAKRPDSRYASGRRSGDWRKLKFTRTATFVVGGWTAPRGARQGLGAVLLGYFPAGRRRTRGERLVFAGQAGSGFTDADLARITARLAPRRTADPPFEEVPAPLRGERRHWCRPALAVEVRFTRWTHDGRLLHPVFLGVRDDVRPADVRQPDRRPTAASASASEAEADERPTAAASPTTTASPAAAAASTPAAAPPHPEPGVDDLHARLDDLEHGRRRGVLTLHDGTTVQVGHLHKAFWPGTDLTKGDLIRFYLRVAPYILPVVADRPLVMRRFPNGVAGPSFYQHRAPDPLPDGFRAAVVREKPARSDATLRCLVGGALPTLLGMAQLAVVSQDPWFAVLPDLDHADQAALDLDPMPDAGFDRVLDVACWLHDELDRLGLPCFPKTSGSRGLHLVIPLPPGTPYATGLIFCQLIAAVVAGRHPAAATVERVVRRRPPDAVYIDCLQNVYGKTLACAYSARASPFAGVSTPLTWTEVHDGIRAGLRPEDFTLRSIAGRLERVGDLWAALRTAEPARLEAALACGTPGTT